MARIFISYKRVDKNRVFKIKDQIESALDEKCWVDLDGIESNMQFASKICSAIDEAQVMLFMYSSAHLNIDFEKDWTIKELNYAFQTETPVILVRLDNAKLYNIFLMEFGSKNNIDSRNEDQFNNLLRDIRKLIDEESSTDKRSKHSSNINNVQGLKQTDECISFNVGGVQFDMIRVEGGTFTMGATQEQGSNVNDDENPSHQVTLDSYYIGKYEVTQALWQAVIGSNPSNWKGDNLPVECVRWKDSQKFIENLNKKTGKKFRLPTEAEWEFAARGGKKSQGYKYSGSNNLNDIAWYKDNSGSQTHEVGTKRPNELGIYDMSGNVWEWCEDWYDSYSSGSQANSKGPSRGSNRVNRGGSWISYARCCRSSYRYFNSPGYSDDYLGLRLVLSE